jgi:hypothetical protein
LLTLGRRSISLRHTIRPDQRGDAADYSGTRTPPSINIQGSNPAMVYVGDDNSSPAVNIEYSYELQGEAMPMPDSCWACM